MTHSIAIRGKNASGMAQVTGKIGNQKWVAKVPLDQGAEQIGIAKLWAREKISNLDDVDNGAEGLLFNAGQKIFGYTKAEIKNIITTDLIIYLFYFSVRLLLLSVPLFPVRLFQNITF